MCGVCCGRYRLTPVRVLATVINRDLQEHTRFLQSEAQDHSRKMFQLSVQLEDGSFQEPTPVPSLDGDEDVEGIEGAQVRWGEKGLRVNHAVGRHDVAHSWAPHGWTEADDIDHDDADDSYDVDEHDIEDEFALAPATRQEGRGNQHLVGGGACDYDDDEYDDEGDGLSDGGEEEEFDNGDGDYYGDDDYDESRVESDYDTISSSVNGGIHVRIDGEGTSRDKSRGNGIFKGGWKRVRSSIVALGTFKSSATK